jgi:hypothetical protein
VSLVDVPVWNAIQRIACRSDVRKVLNRKSAQRGRLDAGRTNVIVPQRSRSSIENIGARGSCVEFGRLGAWTRGGSRVSGLGSRVSGLGSRAACVGRAPRHAPV